jgi:hypothetical protein
VNFKDHFYDLSSGLIGSRGSVTGSRRAEAEKLIRAQVEHINQFYKFNH